MKNMKMIQTLLAVGVLAGGAFFAGKSYASLDSCENDSAAFASATGVCEGHADVYAGSKGETDAIIGIGLTSGTYAGVVGLNSSGAAISGCKAEDTTADGSSVYDNTGCQHAVKLAYEVEWEI